MATANRGVLLRAAKAGRLWARCNFHLTDDYRGDMAGGFGKADLFYRVWVPSEGQKYGDRPEGTIPAGEWDFRTKSGHAGVSESELFGKVYSWSVHSNLNYSAVISDSDPNEIEAAEVAHHALTGE